jgi:hypothetical protein
LRKQLADFPTCIVALGSEQIDLSAQFCDVMGLHIAAVLQSAYALGQ